MGGYGDGTVVSERDDPVAEPTVRSVISAGYAPLDIVSYAGRVWHSAGGTAGNVAAILGFLGWNSSLVVDYGDDLAGQRAIKDLRTTNVSVDLVRTVPGQQTPRLIHEIDGGGHGYRFKCPKCGARFPHSRPLTVHRAKEIIAHSKVPDLFFFDRVNAGTLLLAEHFASAGSSVVFEPSRPARAGWTARAVAVARLVKRANDRITGIESFGSRPSQWSVVTRGRSGIDFRLGTGRWHHSPAFAYPVVDAGGAGDWTTAGLIHSLPLTERWTVERVADALRWAQALAAVSCGSPGARGLARVQSAEAVVRAARFLQSNEPDSSQPTAPTARTATVPNAACTRCLLPLTTTAAATA